MKQKLKLLDRVIKALASFTVSYAFVVITYVLISNMGIFAPLNNETAVQLMCMCLVVAVVHFGIGFLNIKSIARFCLLYFVAVVAVVLFMGFVVYHIFEATFAFFVCLAVMLIVVFAGTYLIAYFDDWKKVQEINEIIQQKKK